MTRVRSMGQEDLLEKGMVTHSSILAWIIPRTGEPGGATRVHGVAKRRTRLSDFTYLLTSLMFPAYLPFMQSTSC